MADNRLRFEGLDELRAELRRLPADLVGEASNIIEATANAAAVEIRSAYAPHSKSGHLQSGVIVTHQDAGKWSAGAIVKSSSPHAYIFEHGTRARHTDLGANRGAMPAGNVFIPAVVKARRSMYQRLKDMLERHGLIVTGEAA